MNKRIIICLLLIITVGLVGAAIYIGYVLSKTESKVGPAPASADISTASAGSCSGSCNSGSECNGYGDPSPGNMWSCWETAVGSGTYGCFQSPTNSGGSSCYLSCSSGWQPCGCNINACLQACSQKGAGYQTHTMICAGCQQEFTCDCNNTTGATPTPTPSTVQPGRCGSQCGTGGTCESGTVCANGPVVQNICVRPECYDNATGGVSSQCSDYCTPITNNTPTPTTTQGCPDTSTVFVVDGVVSGINTTTQTSIPVNTVQIAASTNGGVSFNNFPGNLNVTGSHTGSYSGLVTTNIPGPFNANNSYTLTAVYNGQTCATSNLLLLDNSATPTPTTPVNSPTPTTPIGSPTPTNPVITPTPTTPLNSPTPSIPSGTPSVSITPSGATQPVSRGPSITPRPTVPPNCNQPCTDGSCENGLICNPETNRCAMSDCMNNPDQCGEDMCSLLPITSIDGGRINKLVIGVMTLMFGITLYFLNIHNIIASKFFKSK